MTNLVIYAAGVCSPTLGGAATVNVKSLFLWGRNGAMTGPGRTVLGPAARTRINPGPWRSVYLLGRALDNYGDLTWEQGSMRVTSTITNFGVFHANSETGALTGYDDTFGLAHGRPYQWSRFRRCAAPDPRASGERPAGGVLL